MKEAPGEFFTVRRDHNGLRLVYNLGNELGPCPNNCTFCNVGHSIRVSSEANIQEFDRFHQQFLEVIDGPYHPLIYNQGNVTNEAEFSKQTLDHVLGVLSGDPRIRFVSMNSRERMASLYPEQKTTGTGPASAVMAR